MNGQVPELGHIIKQPDLANTLTLLTEQGNKGFYQGEVASKLVESVVNNGGIWQKQDLIDYQVKERQPIIFHYHNARIVSAPSSFFWWYCPWSNIKNH